MTNNLRIFLNLRNEFTHKCNDGKCPYTYQHLEYGTQCDSPDRCKRFSDLHDKMDIILTLFTREEHVELNRIDGETDVLTRLENNNEYQSFLDKERKKMIDKLPEWIIKDLGLII